MTFLNSLIFVSCCMGALQKPSKLAWGQNFQDIFFVWGERIFFSNTAETCWRECLQSLFSQFKALDLSKHDFLHGFRFTKTRLSTAHFEKYKFLFVF